MVTRDEAVTKPMFSGKAAYVWAFVGCVFCVAPMIRAGVRTDWFLHTSNGPPRFMDVVGSLFCITFLVSAIRYTSIALERIIVIGCILVCVLWFFRILAAYGVGWLLLPESFAVSTVIAVVITVLVGIRAVQIMRRRNL